MLLIQFVFHCRTLSVAQQRQAQQAGARTARTSCARYSPTRRRARRRGMSPACLKATTTVVVGLPPAMMTTTTLLRPYSNSSRISMCPPPLLLQHVSYDMVTLIVRGSVSLMLLSLMNVLISDLFRLSADVFLLLLIFSYNTLFLQ